jgi:eukaryotic-like serine/threonine-protein kinase
MTNARPIAYARTLPQRKQLDASFALPLQAGTIVADRYQVGPVLGRGAMGIVFGARHRQLGRRVAIKVLRPELCADPLLVERFLNEGRLAAKVSNPHLVCVFDSGRLPGGEPYLVMERLDGETLDGVLERRGPLPIAEAVDLVSEACAGLAAVHAAGIVHRDIKPANLLLSADDGGGQRSLKIVDFGISKRLAPSMTATLTRAGDSLGSPCYMSPEQATSSSDVDARSDVWSLGVTLFELLTARPPFGGYSVAEVFAKVLGEPAPSVRAFRPEVDRELEAILLRCLAKDPARRFKNAASLRQALTAHGSEGATTRAWTASAIENDPIPDVPTRPLRGAWLGVLTAVALVAAAAWTILGPTPSEIRAWFEPSLGRTPSLDVTTSMPPPRLDLPRGIYASHVVRQSSAARALPAEPEHDVGPAPVVVSHPESYREYLRREGLVPLEQLRLRTRRVYDQNGRLLDVRSEIVEPPPPASTSEPGGTDVNH